MNLLLVAAAYLPERLDGTVLTVRNVAMAFAARGHRVSVFCRSLGKPGPAALLADEIDGFTVLRARVPTERDLIESIRHPGVPGLFLEALDRVRPDLVHLHHLEHLSVDIPALCAARGIPTVMTLHDFYGVCPTVQLIGNGGRRCPGPDAGRRCATCRPAQAKADVPPYAHAFTRRLGRFLSSATRRHRKSFLERHRLMRESLRPPLALVSPSRFLAQAWTEIVGDEIRVIPNGADERPTTRPCARGSAPVIGYMGTFAEAKGLHVLTSALSTLGGLAWELVVHGSGDERYRARCERALPSGRARYPGAYAPDLAQDLLSRIDLLVMPSTWPENCPLVLTQALAAGVPCVVAGWGGMAELVRPGLDGEHFRPNDPGDLAAVLEGLLRAPTRILALAGSLAGRTPRRWDTVARDYLALYAELLGTAGATGGSP